ncbi:MAG: glycosyltransferase family 9 protein [Steroidobacteraceae bacterium]
MSAAGVRPLVMRCGAMGDMVLLLPLLQALQRRFGTPVDVVGSGGWTRPLLQDQPGVGELFLLQSRRRPYLVSPDQWRLVADLRRRGPAPTWFLDDDGIGAGLLARAGIAREWIVDAADYPRRAGEHCLQRWARLAAQSPAALQGVATAMPAVRGVELTAAAPGRAALDALLARHGLTGRPLLLLQAGNKRTMRRGDRRRASNNKYWPEERWAALIRVMRTRCPAHAIVLLGVERERELNQHVLSLLVAHERAQVHDLAGELPIPVLLALLERASGMIGVDTGPAHAAAALGVPQVVLFGSADPDYYRPWGAQGAHTTCLSAGVGSTLSALPVQRVVAAWYALSLRAPAAPPVRHASRIEGVPA